MIAARVRHATGFLRAAVRSHPPRDLLALAEAVTWLAVGRVAVARAPFRACVRLLGLASGESAVGSDVRTRRRARRIGEMTQSAAARVPWECACLTRALACGAMLRVRGVPFTLYLGIASGRGAVDRAGTASVAAHAWLRCGDDIITGVEEMAAFTAVGSFCTTPREAAAK